ncbi:MAG TPA: carboxypeptidase regulatory-like domain-containing protein [Candidatus Eisenbacteria bacterium]
MKHLNADELSALHDGALDPETRARAERHLGECAECRAALETLGRLDESLAAALAHDPGDAHFESLAARIEERIAAAGAPEARAARGWLGGLGASLRRPRTLAWVGSALALVVVAGVVLINLQSGENAALRDRMLAQRAGQAAGRERADETGRAQHAEERAGAPAPVPEPAPVPAPGAASGAASAPIPGAGPASENAQAVVPATDKTRASAPAAGGAEGSATPSAALRAREEGGKPSPAQATTPAPGAPAPHREAAPRRAYEVKRGPSGEDVPARKPEGRFAQPPPPAPRAASGDVTQSAKPRLALPLDGQPAPRLDEESKKDLSAATPESTPPPLGKTLAGRRTAELPPEPEKPKVEAGAQAAGLLVCGDVKDALGRPVASATVTLVTFGRGVSTDAGGHFCLEVPPGDQTLSVIAVGYKPLRREVHAAPEVPALALTLEAVSALDQGRSGSVSWFRGPPQATFPQEESADDAFRTAPRALQAAASGAARLTEAAVRSKSAPRFEAAAADWERVRARAKDGPFEVAARYRIAEARFRAWELEPTANRAFAATDALTSFLVRAPIGVERDRAAVWLDRVRR